MPIEFITGLLIGIAIGVDLAMLICHIKELKEEWRNNK